MSKRERALERGRIVHQFVEDWHSGMGSNPLTDLQAAYKKALDAAIQPSAPMVLTPNQVRVLVSFGDRIHTGRKRKR
jgi:hypothetical protein